MSDAFVPESPTTPAPAMEWDAWGVAEFRRHLSPQVTALLQQALGVSAEQSPPPEESDAIVRESALGAPLVHALEDLCSHDEIALSDGEVEGCTIECWKHGSQFDLVTGRPLQLPAVLPVRVFPVRIDESSGEILVDPTAAPAT